MNQTHMETVMKVFLPCNAQLHCLILPSLVSEGISLQMRSEVAHMYAESETFQYPRRAGEGHPELQEPLHNNAC